MIKITITTETGREINLAQLRSVRKWEKNGHRRIYINTTRGKSLAIIPADCGEGFPDWSIRTGLTENQGRSFIIQLMYEWLKSVFGERVNDGDVMFDDIWNAV